MAYAMTKQGSLDNCVTYEFMCDTITDMNAIENRYRTIGTIAIVLQGESGGLDVYIAGSDKQWNALSSIGASGSDSGASGAGLTIHICAQNEVSNGLPDIASPDSATIYLVPASQTSGNLYEEYIYVDDAWEKFGGGSVDLSGYAPIANPVFTGSINMGRRSSTTVGLSSVAEGYNATASGNYSHAEGQSTSAYGEGAHAEGRNIYSSQSTTYNGNTYNYGASGDGSHSEGTCTVAYEEDSHAEGSGTFALGMASHAEGTSTKATDMQAHAEGALSIASGNCSHAEGSRTTASGSNAHSEGASTTASGIQSHAEGVGTVASGLCAHAEGTATIAAAADSHVSGKYNVADSHDNWPEWTANVSYSVGDKVKLTTISNDTTVVTAYICKIANNDSSFTESNWTKQYFSHMNYAEIIGNGSSDNTRSNARALDWDGNEYLMGDVYVGCSANSTGGIAIGQKVVEYETIKNFITLNDFDANITNILPLPLTNSNIIKFSTVLSNGRIRDELNEYDRNTSITPLIPVSEGTYALYVPAGMGTTTRGQITSTNNGYGLFAADGTTVVTKTDFTDLGNNIYLFSIPSTAAYIRFVFFHGPSNTGQFSEQNIEMALNYINNNWVLIKSASTTLTPLDFEKKTNKGINILKRTDGSQITISNSSISQQKILVFGDSIWANDRVCGVSDYLHEYSGATIYNCSIGGTRLTAGRYGAPEWAAFDGLNLIHAKMTNTWTDQDTYVNQIPDYVSTDVLPMLKGLDMSTIDIIILAYGHNDFAGDVSISTMQSGIESFITEILTVHPRIRFLVIAPPWRMFNSGAIDAETYENALNNKLYEFSEGIIEKAKSLHTAIINMYDEAPWYSLTKDYYLDTDYVHPNVYGNQVYAHIVNGKLQTMF